MSSTIFKGGKIFFSVPETGYQDVPESGHPLPMRILAAVVPGAVTKPPRRETGAGVLQVPNSEKWPSESNLLRDTRET